MPELLPAPPRRRRRRIRDGGAAAPPVPARASPASLPAPLSRPTLDEDVAHLGEAIRTPLRLSALIVVGFLGGFAVWASLAPLATGAVASGIISPDGSTRTVQHLEGGIVGELLVRDGDHVEAGEPLVVLQDIQPKATHEMLVGRYRTFAITRERLLAEQAGRDSFSLPPDIADAADAPEVQAALAVQRNLFEARMASHASRKRVLSQRIVQLREQIRGYAAQVESAERQLDYIGQELGAKLKLREKRLVAEPEILRLRRMQAEIDGRRGEHLAAIARAEQEIGEAELELLKHDAERADDIAAQLVEVSAEIDSLRERLAASEDVLARTVVTAPVTGEVMNLRHRTLGGVVAPGEPILDIVPAEERLVIDAKVMPVDIDVVHPGLEAKVQLSAYSMRTTPRIRGVVRTVSADRIVDEATGKAYYRARVEVEREELERIGHDVELVPGMPADVLIVTGERTMMQYLFEPFLKMFSRSFREA